MWTGCKILVNLLENLGLLVNRKIGFNIILRNSFFGNIIDSVYFKVILSDEKVEKIISYCNLLLNKKNVLLGKLRHTFLLVCKMD